VNGELRRALLDAEPRTEIDPELDRRPACLGKRLRVDHGADTDVDAREIVIGDGHGATLASPERRQQPIGSTADAGRRLPAPGLPLPAPLSSGAMPTLRARA
jgi:hypothetical protein